MAVPVLLTFLERFDSLERVLVMVQAEVADRLAAPPGSRTYGVPSVKAAWYASAHRAGTVGRSVFWPVPNVDSALVALDRREPPATTATREEVFAVVDAAFAQRRKMLRSALAGIAGSSAAAVEALERAGVDPTARGERLTVEEFARIAEQLPLVQAEPAASAGERPGTTWHSGRVSPHLSAAPPVSVRVRAPGKVNLSLRVGARQEDGYHPLVTIFQAVSLVEEVTATLETPGAGVSLTVSGAQAERVPVDETNLAWRAAESLARYTGVDGRRPSAHPQGRARRGRHGGRFGRRRSGARGVRPALGDRV